MNEVPPYKTFMMSFNILDLPGTIGIVLARPALLSKGKRRAFLLRDELKRTPTKEERNLVSRVSHLTTPLGKRLRGTPGVPRGRMNA